MSLWTGMGPDKPAPKLDPNCQCICHTQPGVMHVAACCTEPARTDIPSRVHLLTNTSGLSLRVEQVRADHPYAEAWVREEELTRLREALEACLNLLDGLVAESGRSIEWGEEDPFRMGEWFEDHDLALIAEARAAITMGTTNG